MKPDDLSSAQAYTGHVKNGVIVLDAHVILDEGQAVRVEPVANIPLDAQQAERVRELRQLFAEWTEEDGKLTEEEADCLHVALDRNVRLGFRRTPVD